MSKILKKLICSLFVVLVVFSLASCGGNNDDEVDCTKNPDHEECQEQLSPVEESLKDKYDCISIAEAIQKAKDAGDAGTSEKYYVYGIIKEVSNATYGEMTITDGTDDLYVYGVYSKDESTRYDAMTDKPVKGDEVVLYGILKTYKEKPEMDRGYLQEFKHVEVEIDDSTYQQMSISEARQAAVDTKVKVSGVVAKITYANGQKPNGFYLVDNTDSIYVYGNDAVAAVSIGNTVTVVGEKTYYVLASEQSNADKHGYKGSCQLQNAQVVENDKGNSAFDKSWIETKTVKEIMDTPVTENITTTIYKVTALIKKVPGTGFINYYIDDLDGYTGSYVYTSCNGADFAWLDEFDGKICTVYLSVINAKSTASGCLYRFLPIEVIDENFQFDLKDAAQYALTYHANDQFLDRYEADPSLEVVTLVNNELLGIEGVELSYSSNDTNIVYFEEVDGKVIFHTKDAGTAEITITAMHNGVTKSSKIEVTVGVPQTYETISVVEAITTADGEEVIVKGIVASSLVNQDGFYLIDETGTIAVVGNKEDIALLSSGDEVVIKGTKGHKQKSGYDGPAVGQNNIYNAEILVNYYGDHDYSTKTFKEGKTIEELYELDVTVDHSTEVYIVQAVVKLISTNYYTSIKITGLNDPSIEFSLYCSSANQYEFLKQFADQEVTLELAICNWNSKNYYTGCVVSVTSNGTKIVNTLNFNE